MTPGQDEEESDPRLDLIRQLMEYRRFKDASERMADMQANRAQMVFRGADELGTKDLHPSPRPLQEISLFDLLEAFRKVLDAAESRDTSREIGGPRFTIRDRITHILSGLRRSPRLSFQQLFQGSTTREELVVSFLALLELIRLQKVLFIQEHPFGEIWIELRVGGTARDEDIDQTEGYEEDE
jgi:segregation and condensation protein A